MQAAQIIEEEIQSPSEEIAGRLIQGTAGALEMFSIYLGDQLGYYRSLADGPLTSMQLAGRTSTQERYAREWLEQQAMSGILIVDDEKAPAHRRRYRLADGAREVLADPDSHEFFAPVTQMLAGMVRPVQMLATAFRSGGGIAPDDYGRDLREGQARLNRLVYLNELPQVWIPAVPGLRDRLAEAPAARIADIGSGYGWSSIGLARAYPLVQVDGFDPDAPSVDAARAEAWVEDLHHRVRFHAAGAAEAGGDGEYDLVIAIDSVHAAADPVGMLMAMRRLARPDGVVLVAAYRVGERFSPWNGTPDWFRYGESVFHGLPSAMTGVHSAGTGSVLRPAMLRQYATEAGFGNVDALPVGNGRFQVYRLHLPA